MGTDYLRNALLTSYMQARLCDAVYAGREGVESLADMLGCRFRWIEVGNNCAGVLVFDDHIHLSVCGSNDRYDWMQNFDTKPSSGMLLGAHRGFCRAAEELRKHDAMREIRQMVTGFPRRPLVLGGHSAGGAIAQLLSLDSRLSPREVVTFGSPKVFTDTSSVVYKAYPWECFRYVMPGDPVPYMPFDIFAAVRKRPRYAHAEPAWIVRDDGSLATNGSAWLRFAFEAWNFGVVSIPTLLRSKSWIAGKHAMGRYLQAMAKGVAKYES